uniref:PRA1 family protein n=1 Tax=Sinocyclocheilus grahami TaxID=75366 RepID=A0A672KIA6_SINGR
MVDVQPPPFRTLDDFLLGSARFSVPDVRNLDRWNNRIINNLLYYQSNYLASAVAFLLAVGYFQPLQLILGATVVILLFLGFVWAAENKAVIRRFRRNHPSLSLAAILGSSYLLLSVFGGVAVFLFGIAFPILNGVGLADPSKTDTLNSTGSAGQRRAGGAKKHTQANKSALRAPRALCCLTLSNPVR